MDDQKKEPENHFAVQDVDHGTGEVINASGHVQELRRHFSLLSLAGVGITVGNVWPAVGGSILVALYNGGPPGMARSVPVVYKVADPGQVCCTSFASFLFSTGSLRHRSRSWPLRFLRPPASTSGPQSHPVQDGVGQLGK